MCKSSDLTCHYNLWDLILWASCSVGALKNGRSHGIRLIKRFIHFWCFDSQWRWNQKQAQSLQLPCAKKNNPHTLIPVGSQLVLISCQWTQGKCDSATKCSTAQVWINSSTWYPIITLESYGFMSTRDSELTMSSDGTKPGRGDLSLPWREGGGIGLLIQEHKALCPTLLNEWLEDSWVAWWSPCPKWWREKLLSTLQVLAMDQQPEADMPAMGILWRAAVVQSSMVEPPLVNTSAKLEAESRKQTLLTDTNIRKSVRGSTEKVNSCKD